MKKRLRVPRKLKKRIRKLDFKSAVFFVWRLYVKYEIRRLLARKPIPNTFKPGGIINKLEHGEPIITHNKAIGIIRGSAFKL